MVPAALGGKLLQVDADQRLLVRVMVAQVVAVMVVAVWATTSDSLLLCVILARVNQPAALDANRIVAHAVVDQPRFLSQSGKVSVGGDVEEEI